VRVLSAEELHRRGVVAVNAGRLPLAARLLRQGLGRAEDQALRARIQATLAYVEVDSTDLANALRVIDEAIAVPGLTPDIRGVLLCQRAVILRRSGDAGRALESFGEAIASLTSLPRDLAKAHLNRGTVHLDRRELEAAAADFDAAARAYAAAGDPVAGAKAEHNRGYTLFLAGDIVGALRVMEAAHHVLAPVSPVVKAVGDQDRAEVLLAAGLHSEGRALLAGAARDYGLRRMRQLQAEAELTLSGSLLTFDPAAARAVARRARRRFSALGAAAWVTRAEATALSADVELGQSGTALLRSAGELAPALTGQGLRWRASGVELDAVRILVRRGELDEAGDRLGRLRAGRGGAPLALRLSERDVRAELAEAQGRRANALQHLRVGLAELHAWQSSFGSLDLQTGVAGHGTRLGVRGLRLAVGSRRPEVLFEWSERARMLASRVQTVRAPQDESIVTDLAELREITQAREDARRTSPEREAELRQRVREHAWRHRGSGEVADPVTLTELRAQLDDDTAVVAYVVTAELLVALVVTTAGTTWVDLGMRSELDRHLGGLLPDLDVAAADLSESMATFVRQELAGRLAALARLLVAPVREAVGERRVVLTPSGVLAGVPWTLLDGLVGRPVTVAQSATSWLVRRTTPLRSATAGFVAGPRVARAEDEVTAAAKEWSEARVLSGEQARARTVSGLAASVDVLHVAAHGRHSAENPMFSGLQLADGPWFGYDIDQLRQVPDVVLLSACEVGRSTVRSGEELIGMTTAWLHAGARCVIASAAAVNDRAAYDVLVAVHQQLAAGVDPATALAAAVPAVSTDTAPVPLVCFG
jgi:tetratricopeptide (TPR) repeat protein